MSFVINTNTLSLTAQQNLNSSQKTLNSAIERLSSGSKINSAKDDAAGQAISNRMTSQINGLKQASSNANDGISLAQTTEGALNQINDNLQRVRELTVQASNGTNSSSDLDSIQNEINQRMEEIDRISGQTSFNGTNVLDGSKDSISVQVGANDGQTISISLQKTDSSSLGLDGFNVNGNGSIQVTPDTSGLNAGAGLTATQSLVSYTDSDGATQYAIQDTSDSTYTKANIDSVGGTVSEGADITSAITADSNVSAVKDGDKVSSNKTTVDTSGLSGALTSYQDKNGDTQYVIDVDGSGTSGYLNANIDAKTGEVTAGTSDVSSEVKSAVANGAALATISDDTAIDAQSASSDPLARLDSALKQVDNFRSDLGAVQNRLDSAISNIDTTQINISSARSRITDADYATEVSNMSKAQILQQAGTSVLAQANQSTQGVLSLLR